MNKHFVEQFVDVLERFGVTINLKSAHSFLRRTGPRKSVEAGLVSDGWPGYAYLDSLSVALTGQRWPRTQECVDHGGFENFVLSLESSLEKSGLTGEVKSLEGDFSASTFLLGISSEVFSGLITQFSKIFCVDLLPTQLFSLAENDAELMSLLDCEEVTSALLEHLADKLAMTVTGCSWPKSSSPTALSAAFLKSFASLAPRLGYVPRPSIDGPFSFLITEKGEGVGADIITGDILSDITFDEIDSPEKFRSGLYQANRLVVEEVINSPVDTGKKVLDAVLRVACDDSEDGLLNLAGSTFPALPETILAHLGLAAGLVLSSCKDVSTSSARIDDMVRMMALSYGAKSGVQLEGAYSGKSDLPVASRDFRYLVPTTSEEQDPEEAKRIQDVMAQVQDLAGAATSVVTMTMGQVGNILVDSGHARQDDGKFYVQPESLLTIMAMSVGSIMAQISGGHEYILDAHWKNVRGMVGAGMSLVQEGEDLPDNVLKFPGT